MQQIDACHTEMILSKMQRGVFYLVNNRIIFLVMLIFQLQICVKIILKNHLLKTQTKSGVCHKKHRI